MNERTHKPAAFMLFFFSGVLSLIFQVVWLKQLVLIFGNTVWAVSTLLTAFMAGLAIGSLIFGRLADRCASPLRVFGLLEGIIGVYGLLTLWLFQGLPVLYIPLYRLSGGDNFTMGIVKFALALLILLPPTICMGGTLPLLARHVTSNLESVGSQIGSLYTVNTFGAVVGTGATGFWLIPEFGLQVTVVCAACLGLIILLAAIRITQGEQERLLNSGGRRRPSRKYANQWVLWVYLISGFTALAYEVIWNRILVLRIGSSVYAYSVVLAVYLLGLTLGAAIMSYYVKALKYPLVVFALLQFAIACDLVLLIKQFDWFADTLGVMSEGLGVDTHGGNILLLFSGVVNILILPTVLFGACFPLAVRLFVQTPDNLGQETGVLYAFNTTGNILGSFCAGFVVLPLIGSQRGLLLLASVNLLIGIYLLSRSQTTVVRKVFASVGIALLFYGGYFGLTFEDQVILTAGVFRDSAHERVRLLNFAEDVYATVSVEQRAGVRGVWKQLSMNGVNVAGTSSELFAIQKLQGHLPLLLHKNPKRVLHIGFGSGGTAYSVSRYPVETITIAEISQSVINKAADYFQEVNHGVLKDPRVRVEFTDGRNKVLASPETYDVILSDSIHPRFSGNGSLYTYQYYQLLKQRLNPGGVVSQWLPFYSLTPENFKMIIKSFQEVFPYTSVWFPNSTMNAYTIVIGKLDEPLIDYALLEAKLRIPAVAADLKEIQAETPYKILDFFFFANEKVREFVGDVPLHTDDNMAVEYISGRVVDKRESSYLNFKSLLAFRTSVKGYLRNLENAAEPKTTILETIDRYEQATTFNLNGQFLFWEGKRLEAFQQFEQIRQLNPEDLEPVEYFGAPYQQPFLKYATF